MIKNKWATPLFFLIVLPAFSYAQTSPKTPEIIVFTNAPVTSVTLSVTVNSKDDIKLNIVQGTNTADMPFNDLSQHVLRGLIREKLSAWINAFDTKTFEDIFPPAEYEKIDWLVPQTIVIRTSLNDVQKNDIKAVFKFVDSIPFYQENRIPDGKRCEDLRRQQQEPLRITAANLSSLKPENYTDAQWSLISQLARRKNDIDNLQKSNAAYNRTKSDLQDRIDSLQLFDSTNEEAIKEARELMKAIDKTMENNGRQIAFNQKKINRQLEVINSQIPAQAAFRDTICKGNYINVQQGLLYLDSVELTIKDGFLRLVKLSFRDSIKVFSGDGLVTTSRAQFGFPKRTEYTLFIDMRSVAFSEFLLNDFLYLLNSKQLATNGSVRKNIAGIPYKKHFSDGGFVFNLGDAIKYTPPQDPDLVDAFVPQRSRLFFTRKNVTVEVPETDVNKIITLNLFSDIIGTSSDKPNGLLQAEAKFFGSLERHKKPKSLHHGYTSLVNYFEVNFTLSKIDQNNRFLKLLNYQSPTDTFSYIHTINLMQYQNLEFGAKLNLFKYADFIHEGHLNIGIGVLKTGVNDSLVQARSNSQTVITPRNYSVYSIRYSLQLLYRLKAISRVGIDISLALNGVKLLGDNVKESGGVYNSVDPTKSTYKPYSFIRNLVLTSQAQIWYYATRDESQRLYARLALNKDIGANSNPFPIIQLGYSSDINKFLQFKSH